MLLSYFILCAYQENLKICRKKETFVVFCSCCVHKIIILLGIKWTGEISHGMLYGCDDDGFRCVKEQETHQFGVERKLLLCCHASTVRNNEKSNAEQERLLSGQLSLYTLPTTMIKHHDCCSIFLSDKVICMLLYSRAVLSSPVSFVLTILFVFV